VTKSFAIFPLISFTVMLLKVGEEVGAICCGKDKLIVPEPFVTITSSAVPVRLFAIGVFPVRPIKSWPLFKTTSERSLLESIIATLFASKFGKFKIPTINESELRRVSFLRSANPD